MHTQNLETQACPHEVAARVKWFDSNRGFGFMECANIPADVLIHANVIRGIGLYNLAPGSVVYCKIVEKNGRYRACNVSRCENTTQIIDVNGNTECNLKPARLKWFSPERKFGFAVEFGCTEDIFIGNKVMLASGFENLLPGTAISVDVQCNQSGLFAASIQPWRTS